MPRVKPTTPQFEDEVKQCKHSHLEVRVLGRIKHENALKEDKVDTTRHDIRKMKIVGTTK